MHVNRWTPYRFANGKVAQNRVMVPPMASQTADEQGLVTDKTIDHYTKLSQSQAGMMFVEYSYVHPSGKGEAKQLGVDSDLHIEGLQKIANILRKSGALTGLQIVHTGGKTQTSITGQVLLGASAVAVPVKDKEMQLPIALPLPEIKNYIQWYVQAAKRAAVAGFDFVELHAAHGYGINQWLSPITNQRVDQYGGRLDNRQRLLLEIVQEIKVQFPQLLISVRMPGQDHYPGGLSAADMQHVAKSLAAAGVDLLNVSSGIGGWRRQDVGNAQGYLVDDAEKIKQATALPVVGVGGISSGKCIDQFLHAGKLDFAAVGRAILNDPQKWFETQLLVQKF